MMLGKGEDRQMWKRDAENLFMSAYVVGKNGHRQMLLEHVVGTGLRGASPDFWLDGLLCEQTVFWF